MKRLDPYRTLPNSANGTESIYLYPATPSETSDAMQSNVDPNQSGSPIGGFGAPTVTENAGSPPKAYAGPEIEKHEAHWRINGYLATIRIWTDAEWRSLAVRPDDAQYYPCGIWCTLRMEPD